MSGKYFLPCRQVEDLQFQLLEQGVISGDQLERTAESSEEQVTTLTSQLGGERERVKELETQLANQLEGEKGRMKELEAQLEVL